MEKITYKGWKDCTRVSNALVDLVVLGEAGPRIIRFGFVGEENEFREFPDLLERGDSGAWHVYGGHRLWHAPEHLVRTYAPDNSPVEVRDCGDFVRTIQPVEKSTGIRKEMDIHLHPSRPSLTFLIPSRIARRTSSSGIPVPPCRTSSVSTAEASSRSLSKWISGLPS